MLEGQLRSNKAKVLSRVSCVHQAEIAIQLSSSSADRFLKMDATATAGPGPSSAANGAREKKPLTAETMVGCEPARPPRRLH